MLSRPALVAERAGTEMAQLDGKTLISAEMALDVELVAVIATGMRKDGASRGGDGTSRGEDGGDLDEDGAVNPRFSDIRIMRYRGVTMVKEGGLCKRQE